VAGPIYVHRPAGKSKVTHSASTLVEVCHPQNQQLLQVLILFYSLPIQHAYLRTEAQSITLLHMPHSSCKCCDMYCESHQLQPAPRRWLASGCEQATSPHCISTPTTPKIFASPHCPTHLKVLHQAPKPLTAMSPPLTEDEIDDLIYYSRAGEKQDLDELLSSLAASHKVSPAEILAAAQDQGKSTCLHMASGNGHLGMLCEIPTSSLFIVVPPDSDPPMSRASTAQQRW